MDFSKLMQLAGEMKTQLAKAQEQITHKRIVGEAGAGMVKITMNGRHEALEVAIDKNAAPSASAEDIQLLEDLVRAAINQATSKIANELKSSIGGMAQGLGVNPEEFLDKLK